MERAEQQEKRGREQGDKKRERDRDSQIEREKGAGERERWSEMTEKDRCMGGESEKRGGRGMHLFVG